VVTAFLPPLVLAAAFLFNPVPAAGEAGRVAARSPEELIGEVQKAIDAKDDARFRLLVDTGSIAGRALDALLEHAAQSPDGTAFLPPIPALMLSSLGNSPMALSELRDLLVRETERFARWGVRSGYFAGKTDRDARLEGLQALLFSEVSPGRKQLVPAASALPAGENEVLLPAKLRDHGGNGDYPLLLRLERTPSGWRVTELVNTLELMERIQAETR
jgi:hypothetical protein